MTSYDHDTIINSRSGERIVFSERGENGAFLTFDFFAAPNGGGVPFEHYHAKQSEYFRMVSGELTVVVEGEEKILRPGDELTLPPRTRHWIVNRGEEEAHCVVRYEPALKSEAWFRVIHPYESAIGREPGLLEIAPFLAQGVETYPGRVPYLPGKIIIFVAGVLGRLLGKKRHVLQTIEQHHVREAAQKAAALA